MREDTKYILSLDGGGFRGYAQSFFLKKFCQQAQIDTFTEWDLISGTSVGAISAVAYALGKKPEDLLTLFREHGEQIFAKNSWFDTGYFARVIMGLSGYGSPPTAYQKQPLKDAINTVVDDSLLLEDIAVPVIITAWNASQRKPFNFSNIIGQDPVLVGSSTPAVDAVLSSSAAPLYFPPHIVNGDKMIDGGVMQNNPSVLGYSVLKKMFPKIRRFIVLSVGTGQAYSDFEPPMPSLSLAQQKPMSPEVELAQIKIKQEMVKLRVSASAAELPRDLLPTNVTYVEWLMENVLISAPAILNDKIMRCVAADVYDEIIYYRFDFNFNAGEDGSLDNATPEHQALLESKVNAQYAIDLDRITTFIEHLRV